MIGRQISHYRILEKLGEGGMGVVYRAEDIRLGRSVAIKFLRSDVLPSRQERARFVHEAKAASALEHSNICGIHEIDETQEGRMFICMPFYEGQTLRAALGKGPMEIAVAMDVAIQLAQGLGEAHAKGIVHRDVKSGNIIVTPNGQVKIMDFGLAMADRTTRLTTTGVTLGTVGYMSPEQVRGEQVDRRTDIWSAGVVLYEMVAGHLPFVADHDQAIMYLILNQSPRPLTSLRTDVPMELERITSKAMAKLPAERYQSATELVADLSALKRRMESGELPATGIAETGPGRARPISRANRLIRSATLRNVALMLAVAASILAVEWVRRGDPVPTSHPHLVTSNDASNSSPVLSPDGGRVVYVSDVSGNRDIYMSDVDGGTPRNLTESPSADYDPAWYPNGASIAFVSDRNGQESIWRMGQLGGNPTLLISNATCPAISPSGKRIAFSRKNAAGELRVGVARLDDPSDVTMLTGGKDGGMWNHRDPAWSPDGKTICYSARHNLWVVSSDGTGKATPLTHDEEFDSHPAWSPSGRHIYFSSAREGSSYAIWRVTGKGRRLQPVTPGVNRDMGPNVSRDGKRLAYFTRTPSLQIVIRNLGSGRDTVLLQCETGGQASIAPDKSRVVFTYSRPGQFIDLYTLPLSSAGPSEPEPERLTALPRDASQPSYSPDGKWIAYHRIDKEKRQIWIVPKGGGESTCFIEKDSLDTMPAWSPDGSMLAFASERGGRSNIWIAPVKDGRSAGPAQRLTAEDLEAGFPSWSPDGKLIAFVVQTGEESDVWVVPVDKKTSARKLTNGAGATKVQWEPSGDSLLVSGRWRQNQFTLRRVSLESGQSTGMVPPIVFGKGEGLGLFDLSRDGLLLVYQKEVGSKGNIYVLEANNGTF